MQQIEPGLRNWEESFSGRPIALGQNTRHCCAEQGRERQQKTTSIQLHKSLELLTGSEVYWKRGLTTHWRLLEIAFPSLFFHIKELILKQYNILFVLPT